MTNDELNYTSFSALSFTFLWKFRRLGISQISENSPFHSILLTGFIANGEVTINEVYGIPHIH